MHRKRNDSTNPNDTQRHSPRIIVSEITLWGITLKHTHLLPFLFIYAAISSSVLSHYLGWKPEPLIRIVIIVLLSGCLMHLIKRRREIRAGQTVLFLLFSICLSLSLLYGSHIVINGDAYTALADAAYIVPFGILDLIAFLLNTCSIFILSISGFHILMHGMSGLYNHSGREVTQICLDRVPFRYTTFFAALLFLFWLPYLLTYWPGFIFGDSIQSLSQALGFSALQNHHPVFYTLFIKTCIDIAHSFGFSTTTGCALYSLLQMGFMAWCLSFLSCWLGTRTTKSILTPIIAVILGASPYVATYSVAMWKDPMFSASLIIVTLLLCDLILSLHAKRSMSAAWLIGYLVFLLIMTFIRSNGIYISLLILFALCAFALFRRNSNCRRSIITVCVATAFVSASYFVITGPVYRAMQVIPASQAETVGVPLNQMARVAALSGNLTESDLAYLDELLPLDLYQSTYRPCCTDLLKWDPNFNPDALSHDFLQHWLAIGIKNPGIYLDAWIMQTFGWWTINQPNAINYQNNIEGGAPRNNSPEEISFLQIYPKNLLKTDVAENIFPMNEWSIPAGVIFWGVLYFTMCALVSQRARDLLLALTPTVGLVFTLLIASPIWYWPRYALALQLLIPFYGTLFFWVQSANTPTCDHSH